MSDHSARSEEPHFLGIGGFAQACGVSRESIRKWETVGRVPPAQRLDPGNRRVWRLAEVEDVITRVRAERAARQQRDRVPAA